MLLGNGAISKQIVRRSPAGELSDFSSPARTYGDSPVGVKMVHVGTAALGCPGELARQSIPDSEQSDLLRAKIPEGMQAHLPTISRTAEGGCPYILES